MDPLRLFLLDQGFPVEYELDKFNTPHTGTTLCHPQNWLCWLRCNITLRHLAIILPLGNIFWRHARFSPKQQSHKNNGDFNVYFLKWQTWLLLHTVNISPSQVQRHVLLSQLYHNFKLFSYFFPYYETCNININSLFHAAIKNLHVKANSIFVFLLLHPPLLTTTISEGITHTQEHISSPKNNTQHSYR